MASLTSLLPVLVGMTIAAQASDSPHYVVVAPSKIRPFSDYTVAVTIYENGDHKLEKSPALVSVKLHATQPGNDFEKSTIIEVEPNTTSWAKFEIPDLKSGDYNLTFSSDSPSISNTSALEYVNKYQSIFVQTDKAMYKPGNKVQFRVLVLDPYLKPSHVKNINVTLKDSQNNIIKEWKGVTDKGIYSNEIQLSTHPVLGDWKIQVKGPGGEHTKSFTVAEYVLPKFEVFVEVPAHVTFKNPKVPVTVKAKYTFGQLVKGEATITTKLRYNYHNERLNATTKTINVDDVGETVIDVVEALGMNISGNNYYDPEIMFDVSFKEDLTGKILNSSASTTLHHHSCLLHFNSNSTYMVPGEVYKTTLSVSDWYDKPYVANNGEPVKIRTAKNWHSLQNATWQDYTLPENGQLNLEFPTDTDSEAIQIEAEYSGVTGYTSASKKFIAVYRDELNVEIPNNKLKIGDSVELVISAKINPEFVNCYVIARNELVYSKSARFEKDAPNVRLSFPVTQGMAPSSNVIVSLIDSKGELFAEQRTISVNNVMDNFVKLSASPNETEPGKEAVISVETRSNSFVGLLGVDQSVLLLKKGNDLSESDVENDLRGYNYLGWSSRRKRLSWGYPPSAESTFINAGALIFTNAHIHVEHYLFSSASAASGAIIVSSSGQPPYGHDVVSYYTGAVRGGKPGDSFLELLLTGLTSALEVILRAMMNEVVLHGGGPFFGGGGPVIFNAAAPSSPIGSAGISPIRKGSQPMLKSQPATIRSKFPETWIWNMIDSGSDGKTSLRKQVPDTITSWVVTGFSINPEHGLGLSEDPAKIRVFRPFFISVNLPYSVTRDESVAIPVNVFNYLDQNVTAEVTLENPGWFDFANTLPGERNKRETDASRTKKLLINANGAATANFIITPKKLGYLEVKVTATSPLAGDGVSRKLLVKPEGETQYRTKGLFVDLREKNELSEKLELDIPKDIVPDSELIEVSAVGDLLGSAMSNVDRLIRQPYGCGEQNMLNFVPNIVILQYLTNSKQLTDATRSKSLKYMELGYQRELTYKHKDNSFSAFGESDKSGSTWLTAFVAQSFAKAQKFINIDSELIANSLKWLASQQAENGSFPEVGHVSHSAMQGGASKGLALTAYVLTAFVEAKDQIKTAAFDEIISKSANYVSTQVQQDSSDVYSLAVASYALNLLNHPSKDEAFKLLESKSKIEGHQKHWEKQKNAKEEEAQYTWNSVLPNAINVEITAYALLSYLQRNLTTEAIPILKWLLAQQNSDGGFSSTQDTVVALGAIAQLAEKFSVGEKDVAITFKYPPIGKTDIKVDQSNALVLQKAELPSRKVRHIEVEAKGKGIAVVQVSYRFNVNKKGASPSFTLDTKLDPSSTKSHMLLDVCTTYVGGKESNMAVMEVTLPSGYTIDNDGIKALKLTQNVKRVETKDDDTVVILYFDNVTKEKLCVSISADRVFKVAKQRPVPVTIYDYYDTSRRATEFYSSSKVDICDICGDCESCDN